MVKRKITAADLFCGAGGSSTGLRLACEAAGVRLSLIAVNHWDIAISTHSKNHPESEHLCTDLNSIDPRKVIPGGKLDLLVASPECFPGGTLILTDRGLLPISQVRVGMNVLTHQNRWRAVTNVMSTVKDTVVVQGHGHFGLETTAEHPFWTRSRKKHWPKTQRNGLWVWSDTEWKPASLLSNLFWGTPTQVESLPIPFPQKGVEFTPDFWWVVGRWLGDGSVSLRPGKGGEITVCCGNHEADGLEPLLKEGWPQMRWSRREVRTATLFECRSTLFANWLISQFGKLAHGKAIPAWALGMKAEYRESLLAGYLSADGHFDGRKQESTTVSKSLAIGLRLLAESLGHRAALYFSEQHCAEIEGRSLNVKDVYRVMWIKEPKHAYSQEIDGTSWSRIRSVQPGRPQVEVFNLSVAEDESYVADGIIVHNCTHHSIARGGKPINDQSRASAWRIVEWASQIRIEDILIENVKEFRTWGPLGANSRPLKRRKGETYFAFLNALRALGYTVEDRILNAADYGDPTSRERLFIRARLGKKPIIWPEPTHAPKGKASPDSNGHLFEMAHTRQPHRTAREIIDWNLPGESIFTRKRPLKPNTLKRIFRGLEKFAGIPFIVPNFGE